MLIDSTIVSTVNLILSICPSPLQREANIEVTVTSSENHSQRPMNMNKIVMGDY